MWSTYANPGTALDSIGDRSLLVAPGQGIRTRAGSRIAGAVDRTRTLASNPRLSQCAWHGHRNTGTRSATGSPVDSRIRRTLPYCNTVTVTSLQHRMTAFGTPLHRRPSLNLTHRMTRHGPARTYAQHTRPHAARGPGPVFRTRPRRRGSHLAGRLPQRPGRTGGCRGRSAAHL